MYIRIYILSWYICTSLRNNMLRDAYYYIIIQGYIHNGTISLVILYFVVFGFLSALSSAMARYI
jgi:hypothetical protein